MEAAMQVEAALTGVLAVIVTYALAGRVERLIKKEKGGKEEGCSVVKHAIPYDRSNKLTMPRMS